MFGLNNNMDTIPIELRIHYNNSNTYTSHIADKFSLFLKRNIKLTESC